jgi:hypothetical protein
MVSTNRTFHLLHSERLDIWGLKAFDYDQCNKKASIIKPAFFIEICFYLFLIIL